MADRIASGEIHIEVNDREAIASLHRIDAEFDKEMAKIDRQEADLKIGADLDRLKRDLREAVARTKAAEEKMDAAENKRSKAQLKRTAERRQAEEEAARKSYWDAKNRADAQKKVNKELDATEKRLVAIAKRDEKIARAADKAAKQESARSRDRLKDIDREAKRRKGINDQRVREAKADERAAANLRREQQMVPKLERSYMRLQDRLEKLSVAKRKAGKDTRSRYIIEIEEHGTLKELQRIRQRIQNAVGRDPIGLPAKPIIGRKAGENLRRDFEHNSRMLGPAAAAAGIRIGRTMGQKVQQGFRNITERGGLMANTKALGSALSGAAGRGATSGLQRIGHAFDGLANMTVRLGPFTSTIRQLMVVMSLLGPTIIDVVGALGSLVSVVGSGAVGLANLGTAIVGGGLPALIGMITVLKPVVGEMKNATKASQNYDKAVREYGKGSDQAAKKLDIFNNVMKNQSAETKRNFLAAGRLKEAWAKATAPGRAEAFKVMGQGLKYLTDNVDFFGKRTNATFAATGGALSRWIRGLNSAEGHQVLGKMMDNFNASLRPALDGLGNLAAVFGRFGASASRFLPTFAKQFRDWSQGLLNGSKNADVVDGKVNKMMESLKSVGRFLLAGGRLFQAFFGGGVTAGQRFTDTMTNAMNRWTAFLKTGQGQDSLHSFFDRAVAGAQALYGALAPVIKSFIEWSNAISPFATAFFHAAAGVAGLVSKVLSLTALSGPITALAATLGTLWAIGKIQTATLAIANFGKALLGVKAVQTEMAVAGAAGGGAGMAGAGLLPGLARGKEAWTASGAAAEKAATRVGRAGQTLSRVGKTAGAFASGLLGIPAPILGVVAAGAVLIGGMYLLDKAINPVDHSFERLDTRLKAGEAGMKNSNSRFLAARDAVGQFSGSLARTGIALKEARSRLSDAKKGTDDYKLAQLDVRDALRERIKEEIALKTALASQKRNADTGLKNTLAAQEANAKLIPKLRKMIAEMNDKFGDHAGDKIIGPRLDEALRKQKTLAEAAVAAQNRMAAVPIAAGRAAKHMIELTGEAEQALGHLARQAGGKKIATTIGFKYEDPRKAAKVGKAASAALKSGAGRGTVLKIVADSKSADAAIKRLRAAKLTPKRLEIIESGGKHVVAVLQGILGRKLTRKEQAIAQKGGEAVVNWLNRIGKHALARKVQDIIEHGGQHVVATLHGLNGIRLVPKTVHVGLVANGVASALGSIRDLVNSIPSRRDTTVTTHYNTTGTPRSGRASGGVGSGPSADGSTPPRQRIIERAAQIADMAGTAKKAVGQKVTRPQYLVGEEGGSTEFVVSNNPAYRKRNRRYAAMAANAVGLKVIAAASGYAPESTTTEGPVSNGPYDDSGGLGSFRLGQNTPPPSPPGGASKKNLKWKKGAAGHKKRASIAGLAGRWNGWLTDMHKGQGMLQREISIQEGNLHTPDSFLVKDSSGNEVIDTGSVSRYGDKLADLREWYDTLLNWISTEADNLSNAMAVFRAEVAAGQAEKAWAAAEAKKYNDKITALQAKGTPTTGSGKHKRTDKGKVKANKKKIAGWRNLIKKFTGFGSAAGNWITDGNQGISDTSARTAEIGYDFRENRRARNDVEAERLDLVGGTGHPAVTAQQQLADAVGTVGGSGLDGGGTDTGGTTSADTGLSYGGQAALADSARADALRDYGSNYNPNVGSTSGPSSPGFAGGQVSSGALMRSALTSTAANGIGTAMSPSYGSGGSHAAATGLAGGASAGSAISGLSAPAPSAPSGAGVAGGGGGTTLNQINNFSQPPADPHTWAQGTAFELGAAI